MQQQSAPAGSSSNTLVFYFVPEDKDELTMPNAFIVKASLAEVTLDRIEKEFPMEGTFFFRFKYSHGG